jgi:hypothetical protein
MGGRTVNGARWIKKHSWVNYYLFDSKSRRFNILPQLMTTEVEEQVAPEYTALLEKHGRYSIKGKAKSLPETRNLADVGANPPPVTSLPAHTLLIQSFTRRILMSIYDPWGRAKEETTHVHLYDEKFQYIGVAWLNDLTVWAQAGFFVDNKIPKDPSRRNFPIDMVLLSGPEVATAAAKQTYVWSRGKPGQDVPTPETAKFYRVMLLSRFGVVDHTPLEGTYERVGLGEVRADLVESWEELRWEDVLVQ